LKITENLKRILWFYVLLKTQIYRYLLHFVNFIGQTYNYY